MVTSKAPPENMLDAVEDVDVAGPRTGSAALNSVLSQISPEDVAGLYQQRGTGIDDRMNAALRIQQVINDVNTVAQRHGLTQQQHFDMLTSLGGQAPLMAMQENIEEQIPTTPEGSPVESMDDYQAFGEEDSVDVMEPRAMAAQRMRDRETQ